MAGRFNIQAPSSTQARLGLIFLLLTATMVSLVAAYWLWILEPRLEADAKTQATVMAHSHSWFLADTLGSGTIDDIDDRMTWAMDEILVLTDPNTGEAFIEGIHVELDESITDTPGSALITRGNTHCLDCFVSEIPLYAKKSRELLGIATFYSNSSFFEQLRHDVRKRLYLTLVIFVLLLTFAWWIIHTLVTRTKRSEATLTQTFDAMSFPVIAASLDLKHIIHSNKSAREYFSEAKTDAGAELDQLFADRHDLDVLKKGIAMSESVDGYECLLNDAKGHSYWALLSLTRVDLHTRAAVILSIADISQLKQAEGVIRDSEERFATVVDSIDDLVYVADMENHEILFMNKAARKTFGDKRRGKCWEILHPGQSSPCHFCNNPQEGEEAKELNTVHTWDYLNPDSNEWYTCRDRAIRWVDGRIVRLETASNVTELKNAQLALETARDEAEAASRAKSEFLATMSHEIRTPMNGIIGMVKLLLRGNPREDQLDYIDAINLSSEQLLLLINDILDISKIEAGKLQLEPHDFALDSLIDEIVKLFELRASEKSLTLEQRFTPGTPVWLHGDATRLRQVLLNLISNAIKFTHEGGVQILVTGDTLPGERARIRIAVTDTGVGIPRERAEQIFEEFTQLDMGTSRRYEGTGLGLAISKRLVSAMGGELALSASSDQGSTFTVTLELPLACEGRSESSAPERPTPLDRTLTILLAEDNPINSKVAQTLLEQEGHRVELAQNGTEALDLLRRNHFDLVLMDLHMPVMDGIEATRCIRQLDDPAKARIPVIALTANIMQEERERCLEAGMDNFLAKPFTPEKLEDMINQTVSDKTAKPA
ncbi:MAG: response regulator [Pseudomonadota bacterium]